MLCTRDENKNNCFLLLLWLSRIMARLFCRLWHAAWDIHERLIYHIINRSKIKLLLMFYFKRFSFMVLISCFNYNNACNISNKETISRNFHFKDWPNWNHKRKRKIKTRWKFMKNSTVPSCNHKRLCVPSYVLSILCIMRISLLELL